MKNCNNRVLIVLVAILPLHNGGLFYASKFTELPPSLSHSYKCGQGTIAWTLPICDGLPRVQATYRQLGITEPLACHVFSTDNANIFETNVLQGIAGR